MRGFWVQVILYFQSSNFTGDSWSWLEFEQKVAELSIAELEIEQYIWYVLHVFFPYWLISDSSPEYEHSSSEYGI
jgi:hypothetical protein